LGYAKCSTVTRFCRFDADVAGELSRILGVQALPTFILVKNGKVVDKITGWNEPALIKMIDKYGGVRKKII